MRAGCKYVASGFGSFDDRSCRDESGLAGSYCRSGGARRLSHFPFGRLFDAPVRRCRPHAHWFHPSLQPGRRRHRRRQAGRRVLSTAPVAASSKGRRNAGPCHFRPSCPAPPGTNAPGRRFPPPLPPHWQSVRVLTTFNRRPDSGRRLRPARSRASGNPDCFRRAKLATPGSPLARGRAE